MLPISASLALPLSSLRKLFAALGRLLCPMHLDRAGENGIFHIASQSLSSFSVYGQGLLVSDEMGLRDLELGTDQYQAAEAGRAFISPYADHEYVCPSAGCCIGGVPLGFLGGRTARPSSFFSSIIVP